MTPMPMRVVLTRGPVLSSQSPRAGEAGARAIDIGERLEVLEDHPTPPNCTSPFAPVRIAETVRRQPGR